MKGSMRSCSWILIALALGSVIWKCVVDGFVLFRTLKCSRPACLLSGLRYAGMLTVTYSHGRNAGEGEQQTLIEKIRTGLEASRNANNNITSAFQACGIWEDIFNMGEGAISTLPPQVCKLSMTLYATCLVRVGRDKDAVLVYDSCLKTYPTPNATSREEEEWRQSKAQCHQRLLDYEKAFNEYCAIIKHCTDDTEDYEKAILGAITCALRLGNVSLAREILLNQGEREETAATSGSRYSKSTFQFLLATVDFLLDGDVFLATDRLRQCICIDTKESSDSDKFLYQWILCKLSKDIADPSALEKMRKMWHQKSLLSPEVRFMELIRINLSAMDDPNLIFLDDKVHLHELLTAGFPEESSKFWPDGMILPKDLSRLRQTLGEESPDFPSSLWFVKRRSGYGSHGNQITVLSEAVERFDDSSGSHSSTNDSYLLQRMVHPMYLLDGHKFSLRIYVILFSTAEMYISRHGLVKIATTALDSSFSLDPRIHMTNSCRETSMLQYSLQYLWNELGDEGANALWNDICNISSSVLLKSYRSAVATKQDPIKFRLEKRRETLGIPKILGLDFVVQDGDQKSSPKAWLVEVNRFPGLEPRGDGDRAVKFQVVRDAWAKASERVDSQHCNELVERVVFPSLGLNTTSSLQALGNYDTKSIVKKNKS